MDIRKVKKLIELLEESGIDEIEIKEGEESVRISRNLHAYAAPMPQAYAAPPPPPLPPPPFFFLLNVGSSPSLSSSFASL